MTIWLSQNQNLLIVKPPTSNSWSWNNFAHLYIIIISPQIAVFSNPCIVGLEGETIQLSSHPPILLPHQLLHTLQHPSPPALLIATNSNNILEFCTALQKHYRYIGSHLIGWPATRENYWSPCFVECFSNHWVTCIHCFWVSIATIKLQVVHSPSCKCL